jgi:hypothetical protein
MGGLRGAVRGAMCAIPVQDEAPNENEQEPDKARNQCGPAVVVEPPVLRSL